MATSRFIPAANPVPRAILRDFLSIVTNVERLLVMTGAGISTESGIPDYRSKGVGMYARTNHRPMTIQQFLASEHNRKRYCSAPCNDTHWKLSEWEKDERFLWLITQNVDGLHGLAGSENLTELHGCSRVVKCLKCNERYDRTEMQKWFEELNPNWTIAEIGELRPDGDVDIPDKAIENFQIPHCPTCGPGSILKTDVVFFGDNVPRKIVDFCYEKVEEATGLLVLGSSLTVMSGYRFVYQASLRKIPILIVNIGPTRGDELATVKVSAKCSEILKLI
uniref:Deacetylase sirtuin-type domain-containing protein n=1 Tax=Panagrolaimus sp. PS1159 TaxID=55785 RepID=A0AC35FN87_9BILA